MSSDGRQGNASRCLTCPLRVSRRVEFAQRRFSLELRGGLAVGGPDVGDENRGELESIDSDMATLEAEERSFMEATDAGKCAPVVVKPSRMVRIVARLAGLPPPPAEVRCTNPAR